MAGQSVVPLFGMIYAMQMWLTMHVKIVPSRKRQLNRQTCLSSFVSLQFDAAFGGIAKLKYTYIKLHIYIIYYIYIYYLHT